MKIVVTSDTHFIFTIPGDEKNPPIPDGDVFIHCGDLMMTGLPDEWYLRLGNLAALPHKTKILVPGNHDFHIDNYNGIARAELKNRAGVTLLDDRRTPFMELDGIKILGIPFVTGLPGWAYARQEMTVERWLENAWPSAVGPDIVISHAPMYGVLDAIHPEEPKRKKQKRVGGKATRKWFDRLERKPQLWFCGHIHESYGSETIDGCAVHNVAMCDRDYKQVNPPLVLDL